MKIIERLNEFSIASEKRYGVKIFALIDHSNNDREYWFQNQAEAHRKLGDILADRLARVAKVEEEKQADEAKN